MSGLGASEYRDSDAELGVGKLASKQARLG